MTHPCNTAGASTPTTPARWDSSWPAFVTDPQRSAVLEYFESRFGIPLATFETFYLLERRHGYVLLRRSAQTDDMTSLPIISLKVQNVGLPIFRKMQHHLKPTTAALQRFGAHATRNIVDLSPSQTVTLFRHQTYDTEMALTPGYVLLRSEGHLLGCGLYTPGRLRSLIPQRQVSHQHLPSPKRSEFGTHQ